MFKNYILVFVFMAVSSYGIESQPVDDSTPPCADPMVGAIRMDQTYVDSKRLLLRMNRHLAFDLFGNRLAGMLYEFAQRVQSVMPQATPLELLSIVRKTYYGYAIASAGFSGTEPVDLHPTDRFQVYVEFGAATVDLESLRKYGNESWYSNSDLFLSTEINSREYFPSDEERLAAWVRAAEQWYLSHN